MENSKKSFQHLIFRTRERCSRSVRTVRTVRTVRKLKTSFTNQNNQLIWTKNLCIPSVFTTRCSKNSKTTLVSLTSTTTTTKFLWTIASTSSNSAVNSGSSTKLRYPKKSAEFCKFKLFVEAMRLEFSPFLKAFQANKPLAGC